VSSSNSPKKKEKSSKAKDRSVSPEKIHKKRTERSESPAKKTQKSDDTQSSKDVKHVSKEVESPKKTDSPKRKSHKSTEKQGRSRAVREGARHQASQAETSDVIAEIKRLREKCERFLDDIAKEPTKLVKAEVDWKLPSTSPADLFMPSPPQRWIQSKDFSYDNSDQFKRFTATMHLADLECTKAVTHTSSIAPRPVSVNLFGGPSSSECLTKSSTSFVDKATSTESPSPYYMMTSPAAALASMGGYADSLPSTKKVASDAPLSPRTPPSPATQHFIGWAQAAQRLCAAVPGSSTSLSNAKAGSSVDRKAMDDIDSKICALLGSKH